MLSLIKNFLTKENAIFGVGIVVTLSVSYFIGSYLQTTLTKEDAEYVLTSRTTESYLPHEHYLRQGDGEYTFIEYLDLDCPHCKKFFIAQETYLRDTNTDATFIVRHFPLIEWHPGASDKAVTTECVAEIGGEEAFFRLFSDYFTQGDISMSTSTFKALGEQYVADTELYELCHAEESARDRLRDHVKQGLYAGIFSTPSIVVLKDDVFLARYDLLTDTTGIGVLEHYLETTK